MKKVLLSLFSCVLFVIVQAQSPCSSVSAVVLYPPTQSGTTNVFGVRVSIQAPHNADITVNGRIYEEGDAATVGQP